MMKKLEKLLELLKQPSTYKGIIGLLALFGLRFGEGQYDDFVDGLIVIYMMISIFIQDS
jgi:hypothetical protein